MNYDQGQTAQLTVLVTDPDNTTIDPVTGNKVPSPIDPTTVVFKVLAPGSPSPVTPPVTRTGLGAYKAEQVLGVGGMWYYRVDTTGPVGSVERQFWVNPSQIPGA